ncbi:two-component sensor histidine kinase [Marinobacterium nitratireducens]|uniref:histidine kinase n=1 Tax=Marinobacterium nitratireducens TaxID=518897 RepID=A0A918DX88_9GAMM|nr:HAMP domain-containing sensor histidine kinase [Marinobacterium nitratireducens]GGO88141.1 two-component sensor histidine kinase [Marinobacterium nitratireducens]
MRYRAPLLLVLLVMVPVLLLGILGYRLQQQEQQLVDVQLQKLIDQQLTSVDAHLQGHFRQLESLLRQRAADLNRLADPDYPAEALRRFAKDSAYIRQLFVLDDSGARLFPPRAGALSREERGLVERLQPLWDSSELFHPVGADPHVANPVPTGSGYLASGKLQSREAQELAVDRSTLPDPRVPTAAPQAEPAVAEASGWIAWYVDAGLMHIYWWRDHTGRTLGFVLNEARLLSDLINRLPDGSGGELGNAEIRLLGGRGELLYGWGAYQGDGAALRSRNLSHPLGSWHLEYHAPGLQRAATDWLDMAVPLLLLAAGLAGLGYLLYREHGRELRLAQQRVNFVNQVSHELKTPLTNLRLYTEMLQDRLSDDSDSGVQRYLEVLTGESRRLARLIDNVLSFARVQRGQLNIRPQSSDPDEQIERILQTFAPLLLQREIDLAFDAGVGRELQYDPAVLEQILNNLLGNCEKYAPQSGLLRVRSWLEGSALCVEVQDRGPGIAATEHQRIFEPFYRSSSRLTDGVSGTGIGLGLARDLARAHGGDLTLEASESGACFTIRLETRP